MVNFSTDFLVPNYSVKRALQFLSSFAFSFHYSATIAVKMSDVITLTEFYEKKGFSEKDAVEKAEKHIREERERERAERERERDLEIRKMEHEEKMKGIS